MATGGRTWQEATPILAGETSDPTPLSGLIEGTARPYFSAWWTIAPTEDTNVFVSAEDSTSTNGPGGYADTILYVYREDQIVGAGGDPDMAGSTYYNNDDYDLNNGRSRVETTLYAGTTYYIRLGASDSSGAGIDSYVLSLPRWYWTDWIQRPDQTTTGGSLFDQLPMTRTTMGIATRTATPNPSNATLQEAALAAFGTTGTVTEYISGGQTSLGSGSLDISVRPNTDKTSWTYTATGGSLSSRQTSATFQMPVAEDFPPPREEWPPGAFDAEQHPDDATAVLDHQIEYAFTEVSYDQSGTGGTGTEDALGAWSYSFSAGSGGTTLAGPMPQGATVEGVVSATTYRETVYGYYDVADVSATLLLSSVQARDPGYGLQGSGQGGGVYRVGAGTWRLLGRTVYRPRRIRYKVRDEQVVEPTLRRYIRPQRHVQRGDGYGSSSAPRHVQGRTRQSTNRNFGIR